MTAGVGTPFDDLLIGTSLPETIMGGAGDDTIDGGVGNDVIVVRRGDGRDILDESGAAGDANVLHLPDHLAAEVRVISGPSDSRYDVILDLGGGQRVTLENALANAARVTSVLFRDGTQWTRSTLESLVNAHLNIVDLEPGIRQSGSAPVVSTEAPETLAGLTAITTFVFQRGGAQDRIEDSGIGNTLRVEGYTIAEAQFAFAATGPNELVLSFAGTQDRIVIEDGFDYSVYYGQGRQTVQSFVFDDGTLSIDDIAQRMIDARTSAGDDLILSHTTPTVIEGGAGNDTIQGVLDDSIIVLGRGDGQDVITPAYGGAATLDIRDYTPEEVTVLRDVYQVQSYILTFAGSDDQITLRGSDRSTPVDLAAITFEDGTIWTIADLDARARSP